VVSGAVLTALFAPVGGRPTRPCRKRIGLRPSYQRRREQRLSSVGMTSPVRRCKDLEEHVVDVGEDLDVDLSSAFTQPRLPQTVVKPGAAQPSSRSTPNPVSGSLPNTGTTTTTVGSVAISLYTVEEIRSTLTPASVVDLAPPRGLAQRCASSSRLRSAQASAKETTAGCAAIHRP
jgi:hypothetical protein